MINPSDIQEHMEVVGADGAHVGTVDKIEGQHIKLTKSDFSSGGEHHYLDMNFVGGVEDGVVQLNIPAAQAKSKWTNESASFSGGM